MGPPNNPYPGQMVDNGDGTFTDPSTGIIYDQSGNSTGQTDPNYDPNAGASGGGLTDILKSLGLTNSDGSLNLGRLLGIIATGAGGAFAYNQAKRAANQTVQGLTNSSDLLTKVLGPGAGIGPQGPAGSNFAPYINAGAGAVGQLGSFNWTPLAGLFGPLGNRPIPGGGSTNLGPAGTSGSLAGIMNSRGR